MKDPAAAVDTGVRGPSAGAQGRGIETPRPETAKGVRCVPQDFPAGRSCGSATRSPYFVAIGPVSYAGSGARKVRTLLEGIVSVLHLLISLSLIFLILLHAGRGGGMSDMFGGGMSSGNIGGTTVMEKNLDRLTVVLAILFAVSTFWLTWILAT
ncbi:MAG: preprotein translocase subunit SecG [Acidimicrobiia bacterium]|nr:preprotein translocase subunit SecG [Acidimicrobiia bacterium]